MLSSHRLDELEKAISAFVVPLRLRDGFNADLFTAMVSQLDALKDCVCVSDDIPKRLAAMLRHVWTDIFCCIENYEGNERAQVEEALGVVGTVVDRLLAPY